MQELEGAGTPLVEKKNGLLRAICSRCAKDPIDVESDDRFKDEQSDVTHNCYKPGSPERAVAAGSVSRPTRDRRMRDLQSRDVDGLEARPAVAQEGVPSPRAL